MLNIIRFHSLFHLTYIALLFITDLRGSLLYVLHVLVSYICLRYTFLSQFYINFKMSSLVKLSHIYKRFFHPIQLTLRHISTSKKSQEVCITNAEMTDQEPVILIILLTYLILLDLSILVTF